MREKASIIEISGKKITVVPIISDACIGCDNGSCSQRGEPFTVTNPLGLPVTIGCVVRITAKLKHQALQASVSLGFPVLSAVLGFFAAEFIASLLGFMPTEGMKAAGVLSGLVIAGIIVILFGKITPIKGQSEIAEIIVN